MATQRRLMIALSIGGLLLAFAVHADDAPRRAGLDWWSLQPITRPTPPTLKDRGGLRNPIDAFIRAKLEAERLHPAPPADRATLVRRVTFDLIGLPPTPAEIESAQRDVSEQWYEKVVERLLASPQYGERWARHWLDVARFGESQGFERDKVREHAWRYRDYVIRSFNADKPYAQFIKEQIAGDVLEPITSDGIVATGFLVCGPWDEVGNTQQGALSRARVREEELEDIVSAVGQTFLGMTVNCARCHDHKFDPIPQADYYRLKSALEGVQHGDRATLPPQEMRVRQQKRAAVQEAVADREKKKAALEAIGRAAIVHEKTPAFTATVKPFARWTFEADARDSVGTLHGTLHGGAVLANGRLKLNGKDAYFQSAPLPRDLREKTLEAWVRLPDLQQQGGGVLSVEIGGGRTFDAIVFGEREPKKWLAGSEFFRRSLDLTAPQEAARADELIHVAVAYAADNRISVYRNGMPYGVSFVPAGIDAALRTYPANESHVLIGWRHTGAGNGFLKGEIEEARLYDRALIAAEVGDSFRAGVQAIPLDRVLQALTADQRTERAELLRELERQRVLLRDLDAVPLAYAANSKQPEPTHLLARGDVEKELDVVSAAGLSAIRTLSPDFGLPPDAPESRRRLLLAEWLASPDNPLPARVLVNRVWQYHFGRGLVASPSDFGFNGEQPTHPELLDWLAHEFLAQGGSIKKLHRLIVLSNTYRQASTYNQEAAQVDADNRWLWRFAPRRLEGEAVRDAMLAVSGDLNPQLGGPSFQPFTVTVFNSNFYTLTDPITPEFNRRTLYRVQVNSAKSPLLDTLDCPDPSVKAPKRSTTTTPLQALGLMNNAFVLRQARHFAERVKNEAGGDVNARVSLAYRLAVGREPNAAEAKRARKLASEYGLERVCWVLLNASEFLYLG
jgi:hypothetical protein